MKTIIGLLILLMSIEYAAAGASQTHFDSQTPSDRQLQIDRYTGYKTNATVEEVNPLLVITQINFPSQVKTVHDAIEHALYRSGYRVDWQQSAEAYGIFSELEIPIVHRKLNLMTLKDAISTLAGRAWRLYIDSVNRKLIIQMHDYVPWQITAQSQMEDRSPRRASVSLSRQVETDNDVLNSNTSSRTIQESESLSLKQEKHNEHTVHHDVSTEPLEPYGLSPQPITPVDFAGGGTISQNIESYDEVPNIHHIESYDEVPNIHLVQYTPGYARPAAAETSEIDQQAPYKNDTDRNRWSVQPLIKAKEGIGSLDEAVIVHYSSISVKELIEVLIPEGWVVHYEVSDAILKQKMVSHAESSRRSALLSLFKELNLKALFYPGQAVVLVAEKEPRSFGSNNLPRFKPTDNQTLDRAVESLSNNSAASESQPEVDTILETAKIIKDIMNKMDPVPK